jgi:hypothetical protein
MADAWYLTDPFWGAAGAIAVIVFGTIGIVRAYLEAHPIQRLSYETSQASLLPDSGQAASSDLKMMWKSTVVRNPHIVEIAIITHGRQDIRRQDFDDQPLEFRLEGAEFLAILRTANSPASAAIPNAVVEKNVFKIGPSHIYRRQSARFTLLADGALPRLRTPSATLHNVDLVDRSVEPSRHPRFSIRWAISITAAGGAAALVVLGILIGRTPLLSIQPPASTPTSTPASTQVPGVPATMAAELQSPSQSSELDGITALQKLMRSSPSDQPVAIMDLVSFIHDKSPSAANGDLNVTAIVQEALNVLRSRDTANDGGVVIDFDNTNFSGANLSGIDLSGASLINADFTGANLDGANLRHANLTYAYVGSANLAGANLAYATLTGASFYQTTLCNGSTPAHLAEGYNCQN